MDGNQFIRNLENEVSKAVVGKKEVFELLTVALLSKGHVIIEGVPGVAKTTIAKTFSSATGLSFSRIQLTPDLMPADITGSMIFDQKIGEFRVRKGPIFANIVLADEINRAPPKTQSALLEAMQERQVTIEGKTYQLPEPFMVIATMNPVEHEGIYNLPEAQLDRFLMKVEIGYLQKDEEILLLKRKEYNEFNSIQPITNPASILELIDHASKVEVSEPVLDYIYEISRKTRMDERILLGASPRASEHLLFASRSLAFLRGMDYVIPDHVKEVVENVLVHRIVLKVEYEMDGIRPKDVVREILDEVEVPK